MTLVYGCTCPCIYSRRRKVYITFERASAVYLHYNISLSYAGAVKEVAIASDTVHKSCMHPHGNIAR